MDLWHESDLQSTQHLDTQLGPQKERVSLREISGSINAQPQANELTLTDHSHAA